MRRPADWMRSGDDRILEVFRSDGNLTPLAVSREGMVPRVDIGRDYAGRRCRELARYGLLDRVDNGLYTITDLGREYLDEELDASTLSPQDDGDPSP